MTEQEQKEQWNSLAYDDVMDGNGPSLPDNEVYMQKYRFWADVAGPYHFDPYYDDRDDYRCHTIEIVL